MARPISVSTARSRPPPFDLSGLSRSAAALDLAMVVLVALLVPIGTEVAAGLFVASDALTEFNWAIVADKWLDAVLVVGVTGYLVYRHGLSPTAFGLQREHWLRQVFWAVPTLCGVYAAFFALFLLVLAIALVAPQIEHDLQRRTEFMEMLPLEDLSATVLLLIPVAIHEELLFRGLLIPYLHRLGCRWGTAIVLSAAIFGVLHLPQGWFGALQIFGVGIMLGLFFLISRSLLAVIIAHLLFNLVQFQVARYMLPWLEEVAPAALSLP